MEFSIREATKQDYEALCEIYEEVDSLHAEALPCIFRKTDGTARSRDFVFSMIADKNSALFVAESQNQIMGFVYILIRETRDIPIFVPRRYAWIGEIAVKKEFRHSGVGQSLVEKAHQWALDKGITQVELNVWEFNEGAIAFYEKLVLLGVNPLPFRDREYRAKIWIFAFRIVGELTS